jgi:cytochrome P450
MNSALDSMPDLASNAEALDPYPTYNRLRESDPAHWNTHLGTWVLSRYDDVRAAFRDPNLSSDRVTPVLRRRKQRDGEAGRAVVDEILSRWIVFTDPPAHARLRKLVEYAFRPRAVARMESIVQTFTDELVTDLRGAERFDFIGKFANPLPVRVIAGMLNVPREHHDEIAQWSEEIVMLLFGAVTVGDRAERAAKGLESFAELVRKLIGERRLHPGEDLISDLIAAEERGDALSEHEIVATCVLLLFAGHETTRNLLANGIKLFLEHRDQWDKLKAHPDLAESAVEEILRYEGPIKAMWRLASDATTYQGKTIGVGQRVLLLQSAANRDPRRFADPESFDIERSPNRHVAFGYSIHYCLGAAIARLEGTLGLRAIAENFPDLSLDADALEYHPFVISRSLRALPLRRDR